MILLPRQVSIALPTQPPAATRFLVRTIAGGDIQELTVAEVQALVGGGGGGGGGQVNTVAQGTGISVNSVDPVNPIVSLSAGTLTSLGLANSAVQPGSLAAVATSGAYADLSGKPSLATVATSGAYGDLTGKPTLATVATTGAYADLTGKPSLAAVALSGAYADLTGTPSIPVGANPSVSLGLTANNGAAATFMRSDASPALNQGIVPTWTGNHTWSKIEPRILLNDTSGGADGKLFDIDATPTLLSIRTRTDADGAGANIFTAARTAASTAITALVFGNATNNPTSSFAGTGGVTINGILTAAFSGTNGTNSSISINNTAPGLGMRISGGAADGRVWDAVVGNTTFTMRAVNDANSSARNWAQVTRTSNAISLTNIALGNATDNPTFSFLGNGLATFNGAITALGRLRSTTSGVFDGGIQAVANNPTIGLQESDGGADGQVWTHFVNANVYSLRIYNDAGSTAKNALAVTRAANVVTDLSLGNATDNNTVQVLGTGKLTLATVGNGLAIKEGSNATSGVATLVAGTVTVNTTKVTATSRIHLTAQTLGTVTVGQGLAVSARTAGTSFTITSGSITDTSDVAWLIIEPAP